MVMGTSSSSGKSLLVAALCRIFARQGVRVVPFKAQNMSNNAAVCADGSEIGRAQAVQALAAGVDPTADMNPVLLKPEADSRSQVVLMGRTWRTLPARGYYARRQELWGAVTAALDRLRSGYDLVLIEGAGSPVELNLKPGDFVNMAVAGYARAPVLLVGDIDRGGIFAQLLGTLWLLAPEERALVRGLVVNKFRGDIALFADGVRILEERGGVPVLGVVPFLHHLGIPDEDAVAVEDQNQAGTGVDGIPDSGSAAETVDIAVIRLPRIANFDDFDPLAVEPGVQLRYVSSPQALGQSHAIILPGTKSTIADLEWLRARGLADAIQRQVANGAAVVGICGGYQMLGETIQDPHHAESQADEVVGLGLVSAVTIFDREKATHQASARIEAAPGWLSALEGHTVHGYEIHMGRTQGNHAWLEITGRSGQRVSEPDGSVSHDGRVWGCYLHGLFQNQAVRRAWLTSLGWRPGEEDLVRASSSVQAAFDRLADEVEEALDMDKLQAMIQEAI
jgi:adenosylcobyric acid synthase